MDRRKLIALSLVSTLAAACAMTAVPMLSASGSIGREVPDILKSDPGTVTLAWAFAEEDVLSCSHAAMSLRHAIARFGPNVRLVAIPVDEKAGLVESFMKRQRLSPVMFRLSRRQYRRTLGSTQLPALFVVSGTSVREVATDSLWSDGVSHRARSLETVIASLIEESSDRGSSPGPRPSSLGVVR